MVQTKHLMTIYLLLIAKVVLSQSMSYTLFKGKVYKYPNKMKYIKFEEDYKNLYPLLNELVWDSIHVTQRDTDEGFPDVNRKGAFGIMFTSVLEIKETSMYRFAVTSDDGSILWIDDQKVIDNDFSNGMHMKDDTIALRPGNYNIKLWYYQAYPTMFGIIYESEPVEGEVTFQMDTILLDQDLLFHIGQSDVLTESGYLLDTLGQKLIDYKQVNVHIIGHTDNIGDTESNLSLSQRRADSIRDYLLSHIDHNGVKYITRGLGESSPLHNNSTAEGRAKNRRVEILIEGY